MNLDPYFVDFDDDRAPDDVEEVLCDMAREANEDADAFTRAQEDEARAEDEARRGIEEDLWDRCVGNANADHYPYPF